MMLKSVLVAADFRRRPDPAVISGARLAKLVGADLHVVHCATGEARFELNTQLGEESLAPASVLAVQLGEPHRVIATRALEISADVIVLGPRLQPSAMSGFLGTTAERVIRECRLPCLLSNAPLAQSPRSILVAVDRSVPAREALRVSAALAREVAGRGVEVGIHLLNISAISSKLRSNRRWVDLRKLAQKMQAMVGSTTVSHGVFSAPLAEDGILTWVNSSRPDLLIMGTHGSSMIGHMLLGSVARRVAQEAVVPLLLVPPRVKPSIVP